MKKQETRKEQNIRNKSRLDLAENETVPSSAKKVWDRKPYPGVYSFSKEPEN